MLYVNGFFFLLPITYYPIKCLGVRCVVILNRMAHANGKWFLRFVTKGVGLPKRNTYLPSGGSII